MVAASSSGALVRQLCPFFAIAQPARAPEFGTRGRADALLALGNRIFIRQDPFLCTFFLTKFRRLMDNRNGLG
jgi:hypothetical protein